MAESKKDNSPELDLPQIDEISDESTEPDAKSPLEHKSLADDKEFFSALESSLRNISGENNSAIYSNSGKKASRRLLRIQIILLIGTVAIAMALAHRFYKARSHSQKNMPPAPTVQYQQTEPDQNIETDSQTTTSETAETELAALPPEEPLSLDVADNYFMQDNYQKAFEVYERLHQALPQDSGRQFMHNFLTVRMALCLKQMGHTDAAERLFRIASAGDSCAMAAIANYQRALIEFDRKQYLEAGAYAYRAMALCEAVTADVDWALSLKNDSSFLVALALTRRIVTLYDTDKDIPSKLWRTDKQIDFCWDMTESQLHEFLKSGNKKLLRSLLGPKVTRLETDDIVEHFEVISNTAPAEELFARFAANANLRIVWNLSKDEHELRRRPVSMFLPDTTSEEFVRTAAGCVGLLAKIDSQTPRPAVIITNPTIYTELSAHLSSISDEALELWQDFVIKYHDDKRLPNAHFASGMIYSARGETIDAIAQFRLVANRYGHSSLAPYALLHSSRIKADLHDYAGAKQDLKQLVEQYNQTAIAQQACLHLAEAAFRTGLYDQAAKTYRKVYNLDNSPQSRAAAALGAAKASFAAGDYALTETWLTRHINLVSQQDQVELHDIYLLLGKTQLAQGKRLQAFNAFKLSLSEELTLKDRIDIIVGLLKCDLEKLDPIQALDILETLQAQGLSGEESIEALLMKCRILRRMHLADKALAVLNDRIDYILEPQLRAKAYFEAAQCFVEAGKLQNAHHYLAKSLTLIKPCPIANQITLRLAEVSLKLDKDNQTIELCSQLLAREIPVDLRRTAVSILAKVYKKQNDYAKAIALLLQEVEVPQETSGENEVSDNSQTQIISEENLQQDS